MTFWSGLLVMGFFVWGYFYSLFLEHATELMISNARGESFHAGLVYGTIYLSAEQAGPLLPSPPREWRIVQERCSDIAYLYLIFSKPIHGSPRRWFQVPLWLPWMICGACWSAALLGRARRIRRDAASGEP